MKLKPGSEAEYTTGEKTSQRLEHGMLTVPFFAWNNREAGRMVVWMLEKRQG